MVVEHVEPGDPEAIAWSLSRHFVQVHGHAPQAVFAAPGRVNLMGEHTDYNGGLCLPIALPHAAFAAVAPRTDGVLTVRSLQQESRFEAPIVALGPGRSVGWSSYAAGVVWALVESGVAVPGMDIIVDSRVPLGSGLSSSAALECAVALAACSVSDLVVDDGMRRRLVGICMRAEREMAGAPTGGMDQTISLLGRKSHALFLDCRDWAIEHLAWSASTVGIELLVIDTCSAHLLSDGGYASRRAQCEAAASALGVEVLRDLEGDVGALDVLDTTLRRRATHVLTEIARVEQAVRAIGANAFDELGEIFNASHRSLRDDFEVSSDELDSAVDVAVRHGALGARMTGGGFGGSAVALVHRDDASRIEGAVAAAFSASGWTAPGFLHATPSGGARQVTGAPPPLGLT